MTADTVTLERPNHMLAGVPLLGMLTPKIGLRGLSDSYVLDGSFASERSFDVGLHPKRLVLRHRAYIAVDAWSQFVAV